MGYVVSFRSKEIAVGEDRNRDYGNTHMAHLHDIHTGSTSWVRQACMLMTKSPVGIGTSHEDGLLPAHIHHPPHPSSPKAKVGSAGCQANRG